MQQQLLLHPTVRYRSFTNLVLIIINVCLSTFYYGYSLAYISTIDFQVIRTIYHIQIEKATANGLLIGIVPFGGLIGSLIASLFLKRVSRRNTFLALGFLAFLIGISIFIKIPLFLFLNRFIQGVISGVNISIVSVFIKEFTPLQLSATLGAFNQFFVVLGIFSAFLFKFLLSLLFESEYQYWHLIFGLTLITTLLQLLVFIIWFPFQTPKYLILSNDQQSAKELLLWIYQQHFVQQILQQKKRDIQKQQRKARHEQNVFDTQKQQIYQQNIRQKSWLSKLVAFHIAISLPFTGINTVTFYAQSLTAQYIPSVQQYLPMIINFMQLIAVAIASYNYSSFGRKIIFQFGTIFSGILIFAIGLGFLIKSERTNEKFGTNLIILSLLGFKFNFGLTIGTVTWLYLPEIVQPEIVALATMLFYLCQSTIMTLFPIIIEHLPMKNPGPVFLFFSIYAIYSFYLNHHYMIETRDKTQRQIIQQYQKLEEIIKGKDI